MGQYIAEIQKHPITDLPAFHTQGAHTMLTHEVHDLVGNGCDVTARGAAGDHHVVGYVGKIAYVQHADFPTLGISDGLTDPFPHLL